MTGKMPNETAGTIIPWPTAKIESLRPAALPRWTVVLPFHNEREFLPLSVRSLALQTVPFHLVLVDNNSSDGGPAEALDLARRAGMMVTLASEMQPGKVAALNLGLTHARTDLVATCDADTIYPHDYLARAELLLDQPGVAAAVAATAAPGASTLARRMAGMRLSVLARLLPQQCLNGGAGQVFRRTALEQAGGFDPAVWNWVLEDHEVMARIERHGRIAYHPRFECAPISRPRTASTVGWNLAERLRYHATRSHNRLDFFHHHLAPRLRERALSSDRLRRDPAHSRGSSEIAQLHPLRG
ncbi:glycosyltransferase family 2 protein [Novosphingobium sp. KCTC 2891]|uniref:glycosyltransferase n=1 Tax=Novosphingobium sp. KCTC 2891 TaxID=2989730 RepID=UPI002223ABB8|nr:glycosyltransferase family A protein [Novosphingobium sp. KCTC 2891]MCW1381886.1 glycosyltransferase family 2 protein [Novosphingobium sp. KCTC 2891]